MKTADIKIRYAGLILMFLLLLAPGSITASTRAHDIPQAIDTTAPQDTLKESDQHLFTSREKMPEFPGGDAELFKFLKREKKYPEALKGSGIKGRVVCTFTVGKDGSISNIQVERGVHPLLDKEAVRLIRLFPKWSPGAMDGVPQTVKFTLPIRIEEDTTEPPAKGL